MFGLSSLEVILLICDSMMKKKAQKDIKPSMMEEGQAKARGSVTSVAPDHEVPVDPETQAEAATKAEIEAENGTPYHSRVSDHASHVDNVEAPVAPVTKRLTYMDILKSLFVLFVMIGHILESTLMGKTDEMVGLANDDTLSLIVGPFLPILYAAMPVFFFVSGLFTMDSFRRKGFRAFLIHRLMRLVFPALFTAMVINPIRLLMVNRILGEVFYYRNAINADITWFLLHLSVATVAFAVVWQIKPGKVDLRIRAWFEKHLQFHWTLYLWIFGVAVLDTVDNWYFPFSEDPQHKETFLWREESYYGDTFVSRMLYFFAGIYAGYAGWLQIIEAMCGVATVAIEEEKIASGRQLIKVSVGVLIVFGAASLGLVAVSDNNVGPKYPSSFLITSCGFVLAMVMTLAVVLLIVYAARRWLNVTPNWFTNFMTKSMYTAFIIHTPIIVAVETLWIWILHHGFGIVLDFSKGYNSTPLSHGIVLAGFLFNVIVSLLIVWPLAYNIRKLPVLNQIL